MNLRPPGIVVACLSATRPFATQLYTEAEKLKAPSIVIFFLQSLIAAHFTCT
jgi:hypothetical protein